VGEGKETRKLTKNIGKIKEVEDRDNLSWVVQSKGQKMGPGRVEQAWGEPYKKRWGKKELG